MKNMHPALSVLARTIRWSSNKMIRHARNHGICDHIDNRDICVFSLIHTRCAVSLRNKKTLFFSRFLLHLASCKKTMVLLRFDLRIFRVWGERINQLSHESESHYWLRYLSANSMIHLLQKRKIQSIINMPVYNVHTRIHASTLQIFMQRIGMNFRGVLQTSLLSAPRMRGICFQSIGRFICQQHKTNSIPSTHLCVR